jgi:3'-phosphoadenosine 5'-phosphosulfate (PAPS) 3'-phosphatase
MHPMLNIAVKAARRAGSVSQRASLNLDTIRVEKKKHNDFVTDVDRAAEQAIVDMILEAYPKHAILAEESGAKGVGSSNTNGSSTPSTAPPTSCMAISNTPSPSRWHTRARCSRPWCTTLAVTICLPPRAVLAPSSTTAASVFQALHDE